jgi:hypothetical protein
MRNSLYWTPIVVAVTVLIVVLVVTAVVYVAGGFKAEPPYTTWCDQGKDGNRLYQSRTGDLAVVPADKTC